MYTNPTNVPEESAEPILSFEADTENIPSYLGNTLVSLFGYVHGDICLMYILGIPQGWSLGRGPVFFFRTRTGGTIPLPVILPATYIAQTAYASFGSCRTLPQKLLTPSGPPQRFFPACSRTCQACSYCPLKWGSWAAYCRARQLLPPGMV
jgi:hypothetical protein